VPRLIHNDLVLIFVESDIGCLCEFC
jgi:hypothetical protein